MLFFSKLSCHLLLNAALSGGPLGNEYKAASFHFHWGTSSSEGSEHTVGGKKYAAEVRNDTSDWSAPSEVYVVGLSSERCV